MFTDIVGYSRTMEADEVRMLRLLDDHIEIVEPATARHGGEIIKRVGDAFLISFDSAVNAVHCALDIQESHRTYNAGKPESDQVLVRIGIHLGDIVIREDDVFGDSVNIAQRIQALAEPGGICITRSVRDVVIKRMDINVSNLGLRRLKNMESIEVFHILSGTINGKGRPSARGRASIRRRVATSSAIGILILIAAIISFRLGLLGKNRGSGLMASASRSRANGVSSYFSNYQYRNDSRVVALTDEYENSFRLISAPPNDIFKSVTIVDPVGGEKVKCLLTTQGIQSGNGRLICLDAGANVAFMDSILESEVPLGSVYIGPELGVIGRRFNDTSWTRQAGYECSGAWVADLDGNDREIIALFHNNGWFAYCIRVYRNQVDRKLLMSVWHPGFVEVRGFWDISGDPAKEIICTGSLNWKQNPHLLTVFCLKFAKSEVQSPVADIKPVIYDEHGIVSPGWGCLQWYDIIPFPAQPDSAAFTNYKIYNLACSEKADGKDAELVVTVTDGRVYRIAGDGRQLSLGLGDFGRGKYRGHGIQADLIRMAADNVDSLLAGWFNDRLFLRLVD